MARLLKLACTISFALATFCSSALAKDILDGTWMFQSATKNGNSSHLPEGDVLLLNIQGSSGEVTITPGSPGVVESIIKQFCTRLYGSGKITYLPNPKKTHLKMAKFDVSEVRGEHNQGFCPATQVIGQLTGKDVADQLENGSLNLDFHYNTTGNRLVLTTKFKKDTVALTFEKVPFQKKD